MLSANDEPQLELPLPLPARQPSLLAPALLLLGLIGGGVYAVTDGDSKAVSRVPAKPEDLSANVVTFISSEDRAGIAAAVAALRVPPPQRAEIAQAVDRTAPTPGLDRVCRQHGSGWRHRRGRSLRADPADRVDQGWTPVAVALDDSAPIGVTAVRDGQGGGVTVAFATSGGTMPMRVLRPGERIEVVP